MPPRRHRLAMQRESLSVSVTPSVSSDARSDTRTVTSLDESEYTRPVTTSMDGSDEDEGEVRLVIAVDYGTTYTGVASATPSGNTVSLSQIFHIADWGDGMSSLDKVPSVISYSKPSPRGEQQWGRDISPDAITMVHTKLELDVHDVSEELDFILQSLDGMKNLHFGHIRAQGNSPAYTYKTPEEIVTDYLGKVFQHCQEDVNQFSEEFTEMTPTDLVITVPTDWVKSYRAMNSTYRALTTAGFNKEAFPNLQDVMFVTEAEAAAHYTARSMREHEGYEALKEGSYFILCDAGGGTVDVVSYRVKKVFPKLELEQVGVPTARRCGSQFINFEFKKWLQRFLGIEIYSEIDPNTVMGKITSHVTEGPAMRELMIQFDTRKKLFDGMDGRDVPIELPAPFDNLNLPGRVDAGDFEIPANDMESFFVPSITSIIELIQGHFGQIERRGAKPKNIFLVGGYGKSPYLQRQLKELFGRQRVNVRPPKSSWTAVVEGAVICGVEKATQTNLIKATSCRHSYGIKVAELWSDTHENMQDKTYNEIAGANIAEGQLLWMLNIGDVVLSSAPYTKQQEIAVAFEKNEEKCGSITIYRSSEPLIDRPTIFRNSWADLEPNSTTLSYDLRQFAWTDFDPIRRKTSPRVATLTLELSLDGANVTATVRWKGQKVGGANIVYP